MTNQDAIRWALILSALVHIAIQAVSAWDASRVIPTEPTRLRWWCQRHAGLIRAPGDTRLEGSPSLTGLYLAIVLPLAPWPLWPLFAFGLYLSGSWLAIAALSGAWALTAALSGRLSP